MNLLNRWNDREQAPALAEVSSLLPVGVDLVPVATTLSKLQTQQDNGVFFTEEKGDLFRTVRSDKCNLEYYHRAQCEGPSKTL